MDIKNEFGLFDTELCRVLIVPGLHDSGAEHWQSQWERLFPRFTRIQQNDWSTPRCTDWVGQIDAAVRLDTEGRTILVGHSLGCAAIAHWATDSGRVIRGALLVAPSDVDAPSAPAGPIGFSPMALGRLNFPSTVIASSDDPFVSLTRARAFAHAWGSSYIELANVGHINSASNIGPWPFGLGVLRQLAERRNKKTGRS